MVILILPVLIVIIIMLAHYPLYSTTEPLLYIVLTPPFRFHLIIITVRLLTMPMLTARIQLAVDHNNNNNVSIKAIKLCNLRLQSCCRHEAGCWRDEPVSRLQQFVRIARSGPAPLGGWCRVTDCEDSGPTRGGYMIGP